MDRVMFAVVLLLLVAAVGFAIVTTFNECMNALVVARKRKAILAYNAKIDEIESRADGLLCEEEIKAGWHYCPEFDGLLTKGEVLGGDQCICVREKELTEACYARLDETERSHDRERGYDPIADAYEEIGNALLRYYGSGCKISYSIEGNKLTFTIDAGDRIRCVGGFAGGETKGVVTFDTPILLWPSIYMISGVDPLGGKWWKELLYKYQEACLTYRNNREADATERDHDAEREARTGDKYL